MMVPVAVVEKGTELKTTMLQVLEYYVGSDPKSAQELAFEIRRHYGTSTTGHTWGRACWRVFTLLEESYEEIRDAVGYVFRNKPAVVDLFPTLRAVGRRRTRSNDNDVDVSNASDVGASDVESSTLPTP
ncbi:MAG: hypothetical protein H6729_00340 [Deltaproteobacteria bacterium]|nr:hypothetical protein [Deltaproteobacteria bacterium]